MSVANDNLQSVLLQLAELFMKPSAHYTQVHINVHSFLA